MGNRMKNQTGRRYPVVLLLILLTLLLSGCRGELIAGKDPEPSKEIAEVGRQEPSIRISEVMASNKATLADRDGNFGDWVELYNVGTETVNLAGFVLRCGKHAWAIPEKNLEPGAYLLVFCDREDRFDEEELHSNFAISALGERIRLLSPDGVLADLFPAVELEEDCSAWRDESGDPVATRWPTPGYENTESGYEEFQKSRSMSAGSLVISEVLVCNRSANRDGTWDSDWVEILNLSDEPQELSDYYLSDRESERQAFHLPARQLAPGEYVLISCDPERAGVSTAPFGLNAEKEELYLSRSDGNLADYVCLHDLPYGASYGRTGEKGFFYYETPSPRKENTGGRRFTGEKPALIGQDGIFNDVSLVICELSGRGTIRYTTDGSEPDGNSPVYPGPIGVNATCVIRAASFEENHMRSEVLNLSYILNEGHALPVVSLVCDDEAMFSNHGVYNSPNEGLEIPAAVMFYEKDGGFRLDCGLKLHGATSKVVQVKKSLKLNFRKYYGGILEYDLFGGDVSSFSSILLRAAQEGKSSSYMRDALAHELAKTCFPELPSQDHRYAVLYINGQYWGLYNIREAHSAEHYANHYGYGPDSVTHWHEKWQKGSTIDEISKYALSHDLSKQEHYDYVASSINTDSVIAWLILQEYTGNIDFNSPNMRFYWSDEDQQLRYALVDLDLGFFTEGYLPGLLSNSYYAYTKLAGALMKNEGFRHEFLRKLNEVLSGPMSDESVLQLIDRFAAEIAPEIGREKARWGGKVSDWEHLVDDIRYFITKNNGHAKNTVKLLVANKAFRSHEVEEYLSSFVIKKAG